jgi:putative transposase
MPKLRHYDHLGSARFVTFTCHRRQPFLALPSARDIVLEHLERLRGLSKVKIFGYVIMPEHVHFVLLPPNDQQLGRLLGLFKSESAKRIKRLLSISSDESIWQNRGYDHNCRSLDATIRVIEYCHNNPVRRGLCEAPADWKWSSARWYAGIRDEVFGIDDIDGSME